MKTETAFKHLTSQRGWYSLCGINPDTARSLKRHFNDGKLSTDKQFELLKAAGYKVKTIWRAPTNNKQTV